MEGHDKPDSVDGSSPVEGQVAEETVSTAATQLGEWENRVEEKNIEDVNFNHFSLIYESNILSNHVDDAINVPPNKKTNKSFLFFDMLFP